MKTELPRFYEKLVRSGCMARLSQNPNDIFARRMLFRTMRIPPPIVCNNLVEVLKLIKEYGKKETNKHLVKKIKVDKRSLHNIRIKSYPRLPGSRKVLTSETLNSIEKVRFRSISQNTFQQRFVILQRSEMDITNNIIHSKQLILLIINIAVIAIEKIDVAKWNAITESTLDLIKERWRSDCLLGLVEGTTEGEKADNAYVLYKSIGQLVMMFDNIAGSGNNECELSIHNILECTGQEENPMEIIHSMDKQYMYLDTSSYDTRNGTVTPAIVKNQIYREIVPLKHDVIRKVEKEDHNYANKTKHAQVGIMDVLSFFDHELVETSNGELTSLRKIIREVFKTVFPKKVYLEKKLTALTMLLGNLLNGENNADQCLHMPLSSKPTDELDLTIIGPKEVTKESKLNLIKGTRNNG